MQPNCFADSNSAVPNFADSGHFIVITGYDKDQEGFYVHNSLRTSDSKKVWDFDDLKSQIKAMWVYSYDK